MSVNRDSEGATAARRRLQQRQTLIFGAIILVLLFALLINVLIFTKTIPSPFAREFTTKATPTLSSKVACPEQAASTVALNTISVKILNGTGRAGLARNAADTLAAYGIKVGEVGNWNLTRVPGVGVIQTGPQGVNAAYTLQRILEGMPVVVGDSQDATVTVILGSRFERVGEATAVTPGAQIALPQECVNGAGAPTAPAGP